MLWLSVGAPCPVQCSRPWRTLAVVMTILALLGLVMGLYFTFRGQKDEPSPPMGEYNYIVKLVCTLFEIVVG